MALEFLLALEGGDGTVLRQPYHLVQGQRYLSPAIEGKQTEECQADQLAYIYSILHILLNFLRQGNNREREVPRRCPHLPRVRLSAR